MKIMLVTRAWSAHKPGGMIHVVEDRAVALAGLGHDVHVVTTAPPEWFTTAEVSDPRGFTVHYSGSERTTWTAEFATECERFFRLLAPDVVHSDSLDFRRPWWDGVVPRMALTMHGTKVNHWHTLLNEARAFGEFREDPPSYAEILEEVRSLRSAAVVIATTPWDTRVLRDQYGLTTARHVPNPIPGYFFEPRAEPRPTPTYFACAAVSQATRKRFYVAERAGVRAGVKVEVAHDLPRVAMPAFYDGAVAVVVPTVFAQCFDLTIAEGRARGVPAIVSATAGYLEGARPWDRVVELGDVQGLADAMAAPFDAVPDGAADENRPEVHAENWLAAVAG